MRNILDGSLRPYEHMMHEVPGEKRPGREDSLCRGCPYHRSKWKYRFCFYLSCPYIQGMLTFREEVYGSGR